LYPLGENDGCNQQDDKEAEIAAMKGLRREAKREDS
jgi:hypothetical protein